MHHRRDNRCVLPLELSRLEVSADRNRCAKLVHEEVEMMLSSNSIHQRLPRVRVLLLVDSLALTVLN